MNKNTNILKVFGRKLKNLRIENELSQEELAKLMGYNDRSTISKLESGQIDPNTSTIEKLAQILGVSAFELSCLSDYDDCFEVAEPSIQYNAHSSDSLEFLPYLDKATDETKAIIRKILDMPAKEEKILRDRTV